MLYWQCFPSILRFSANLALKAVLLFCIDMIIGTKIALASVFIPVSTKHRIIPIIETTDERTRYLVCQAKLSRFLANHHATTQSGKAISHIGFCRFWPKYDTFRRVPLVQRLGQRKAQNALISQL
jgi:hypothetical protein